MENQGTVLIVDDQPGEILWLLDWLDHRGYGVHVVSNEKDALAVLDAIHRGEQQFVVAIFDVMVSTHSIEDIVRHAVELDDDFYEASKDTGLRLCQRARELELKLPIACLTVRQDEDVEMIETELGIPVFHRIPLDKSEDIMGFLDKHLPPPKTRQGDKGEAKQ